MKTDYTIYRADGTKEDGEVDWPAEPDYATIRALVEPIVGGPLEHVAVLHDDDRRDMFVDEIGHMRPKLLNEAATKIYRQASMDRGYHPESLPTVVGDAILFHRLVWF